MPGLAFRLHRALHVFLLRHALTLAKCAEWLRRRGDRMVATASGRPKPTASARTVCALSHGRMSSRTKAGLTASTPPARRTRCAILRGAVPLAAHATEDPYLAPSELALMQCERFLHRCFLHEVHVPEALALLGLRIAHEADRLNLPAWRELIPESLFATVKREVSEENRFFGSRSSACTTPARRIDAQVPAEGHCAIALQRLGRTLRRLKDNVRIYRISHARIKRTSDDRRSLSHFQVCRCGGSNAHRLNDTEHTEVPFNSKPLDFRRYVAHKDGARQALRLVQGSACRSNLLVYCIHPQLHAWLSLGDALGWAAR
eukprot:CAMPEP_0119386372 /NCGR_PEP_ID=MMETSP1334-20130426/95787_1 /TAXON_ID=127549 /ORGANISM="Calcidiscus leptoporus, Strain RCC1130" /LENGTH=316 /DNA_ID=CAMNT_0007407867 /DNA_START=61 /DNA_END=1008 /DNA_ORIENTATION=-